MKKRKWPVTLDIKPGLRWSGKICVEGPRDDGYQVQFDATVVKSVVAYPCVYDRAVLSAKQIYDWTGVEMEQK